jgi:RNA polymerase-binding transcription factor DksA
MDDRPQDQSTQSGLDAELDVMERDLADVEVALVRLDAGTYWTCEATGTPLPDGLLAEHPAARRVTA